MKPGDDEYHDNVPWVSLETLKFAQGQTAGKIFQLMLACVNGEYETDQLYWTWLDELKWIDLQIISFYGMRYV